MALYVVITSGGAEAVSRLLSERFPDNYYRVNDSSWIVAAPGLTSRQVSDKLEITVDAKGGPNQPGAVLQLGRGYWGATPPGLWEWIEAKNEAADA